MPGPEQEPNSGAWDPVSAARRRYPGLASESDEKIGAFLADPQNFRSSFPEYASLDDASINRNMAKYLRPDALTRQTQSAQAAAGIRPTRTPAAVQASGEPRRGTELELPQVEPTGAATRMAAGAAAGARAMVPSLSSLKSLIKPPQIQAYDLARGIYDQYKQAREEGAGPASAVASAAGSMAGIDAQGIRERARRGDVAGVIGEGIPAVAATVLAPKVPEAVSATARTGAEMARQVGRDTKAIVAEHVLPEAPKAIVQATQPGVNIPRAPETLPKAGARIQQMLKSGQLERPDGTPIERIASTGDLLDAIQSAKKNVWSAIEQRKGKTGGFEADTSKVADAMEKSVSKRTAAQYPGQADAIQRRAATYRGNMSLSDIEEAIQDANNDLRNFYKRAAVNDAPVSPEIAATQAEVKALRDLLDERVEALNGKGVKDLKQEYGNLRDLERATAKQHAVATRTKGAGLWEGLAALHAAGDLLSGNMLGAAKAAGVMSVGRMLKSMRNPDFLIEQSFHGPKAFRPAAAFERAPGVQIRGALPRGPVITPPPADTSFVRGVPAEVQPLAENRQLPAAGATGGPRTVAGPGQYPISLPSRTPRPLIGPERQLPERASEAGVQFPHEGGSPGRGPNRVPRPFEMARSTLENLASEESVGRDAKTEMDALKHLWEELPAPGRYVHNATEMSQGASQAKPEIVAYGVKSPKPAVMEMFPWLRDVPMMTLSRVRAALERGKGVDYDRLMRAASDYLKKERDNGATHEREPGED